MADFGLLAGLASGLEKGFSNYRDEVRYGDERKDRKKRDAIDEALKLKQLKDAGLNFDKMSGEVSETEEGTRKKKAGLLKERFDIVSDALKSMSEDERGGTAEGQKLRKQLGLLTDQLSGVYGGAELPIEKTQGILTSKSPKSVAAPNQSTFLGQPRTAITETKATQEIPGLIGTSKGFLPGQLSKEDKAFNQSLKKKAAEIELERRLGPGKENQYKAAGLGKRAMDADAAINKLKQEGYDRTGKQNVFLQGISDNPLSNIKYVGEGLASGMRGMGQAAGIFPERYIQNRQAEKDFLSAVLRKESGASISPSEYEMGEEIYFDRPGDSPTTRAQKAKARSIVVSALKNEAGQEWDKLMAELAKREQEQNMGLLNK